MLMSSGQQKKNILSNAVKRKLCGNYVINAVFPARSLFMHGLKEIDVFNVQPY